MKQNERTAGFTLVELIVVIAIMGILAGVGTVGYSGYIKMARESADNQILAAVNTAFASACLESNVEVADVSAASISMMNQKVYGVSSVDVSTDGVDDSAVTRQIATSFTRYFDKDGQNITFQTANVNSLAWNAAKGAFEIAADFVDALVMLPNGNFVNISKEDVEAIQNSSYAELGLDGITETIKSLNSSSGTLCDVVVGLANISYGVFDLTPKLTAVLAKYTDENLGAALKNGDEDATEKVCNGLQMVVAEYIGGANATKIAELENMPFSGGTVGTLKNFSGSGGTKTCSALALQYALATGCAQTEYNDDSTITLTTRNNPTSLFDYSTTTKTYSSISECLNSEQAKNNPVEAIEAIKGTTAYANYKASEQYQKDLNGFTGSMGVVGDNLTSIGYDNYLINGIDDENAQAVLGAAVGSGN